MNEDVNSDMTYFDHFFSFPQSGQGDVHISNYELYYTNGQISITHLTGVNKL